MKVRNLNSGISQKISTNASRTVATQVYNIIRDGIIQLNIEPGSSMSEQEMANKLGVSRTPVREAFIRLSREHMVIIEPQRRTKVAKIRIDRVKQERFIRESLELAALEKFILYFDQSSINKLKSIIKLQEESAANKEYNNFLKYDDEFHHMFYQSTDNDLCVRVIRHNSFDYQRLRYLSNSSNYEIQMLNIEQHKKLLKHIEDRELLESQVLLRKHLRRLFDELKELCANYPEYFSDAE